MLGRYHWLGESVDEYWKNHIWEYAVTVHTPRTLDMTAVESFEAKEVSVDLICDNPEHLKKYFKDRIPLISKSQMKLDNYFNEFKMPRHHPVLDEDLSDREFEVLKRAWELQPSNYEELYHSKVWVLKRSGHWH